MKYRPITDLTDDEVKYIVNEIYEPEKITKIIRKIRKQEIAVVVKTQWHYKDDDDKDVYYLDSEELILRDPFANETGFDYDPSTYSFDYCDDQMKFKKFCLAKGVCCFLKDNPYLEAERRCYVKNHLSKALKI